VIAWPYPIGFDTIGYYIPAMRWWINPFTGQMLPTDALGVLRSAGLFYVLAAGFNRYLVPDPFMVVELLGPILTGFVALSVYLYGRLGLGWASRKALFASLIATLYFVGLRLSWDLYRNMLGVIFLFATLIALEVSSGVRKYLLIASLTLLTFMSHQITGVILLGVLLFRGLWFCARGRLEEGKVNLYFSLMAAGLLLYQLYLPQAGRLAVSVPTAGFASLETATYVLGFPLYCFIFLLPLSIPGVRLARALSLNSWTLVCLLLLVPVLVGGLISIPVWPRWPLMFVYPLSFYFADGFEAAMRSMRWRSPQRLAVKISAIGLLALIAFTSGQYLLAYPEHPFPYFSQYNPYLRYVQSSMLQNSISIRDVRSLLSAIDAVSPLLVNGTVLVVPQAVYVWAVNRLGPSTAIVVYREPYESLTPAGADKAIEQIAYVKLDSGYRVYTIWWTTGSGWYAIPQLPETFKLLESTGTFGVYIFNPSGLHVCAS